MGKWVTSKRMLLILLVVTVIGGTGVVYDAVSQRAPVREGTQEINNYPDAVNVLDVGAKGDGSRTTRRPFRRRSIWLRSASKSYIFRWGPI